MAGDADGGGGGGGGVDSPPEPQDFVTARTRAGAVGIAMRAGRRENYLGALSPDVIAAVAHTF
ncbi:hypothetical protein, partial [Nocardia cyriacigeorgica]|uniref:hypothetical protein n=1 Tax=Nocardia cyriacigeorgica TaxID=135487 RepID=UPI0024581BF2